MHLCFLVECLQKRTFTPVGWTCSQSLWSLPLRDQGLFSCSQWSRGKVFQGTLRSGDQNILQLLSIIALLWQDSSNPGDFWGVRCPTPPTRWPRQGACPGGQWVGLLSLCQKAKEVILRRDRWMEVEGAKWSWTVVGTLQVTWQLNPSFTFPGILGPLLIYGLYLNGVTGLLLSTCKGRKPRRGPGGWPSDVKPEERLEPSVAIFKKQIAFFLDILIYYLILFGMTHQVMSRQCFS